MSRNQRIIHGLLCAALAALLLLPILFAPVMREPSRPLLTGYGCEGAGGTLYAAEEDHFPPCEAIEGNEP